MSLTPKGYRSRLLDARIDEYLSIFGAVSIEGAKYCGKTWTCLNHANSAVYLDDPSGGFANRQIAVQNPSELLKGKEPVLLDEWQETPGIWDAVRHEVDRGTKRGRFLLTGSSTPYPTAPSHSGAGRIARLQLRPMTLFESGDSSGAVSLKSILDDKQGDATLDSTDLSQIASLCIRGGWPESVEANPQTQQRLPLQYLESIYASEISGAENVRRDPDKVKRLLRALARNSAMPVTNTALKWDVTDGSGSISAPTLASYLGALKRIHILEELPGWAPRVKSKTRMRSAPKRYLCDPSLVCASLGLSSERLLADMPTFGSVFEGLCLRDLQVYASLMDADLFHYHDNSGLEVDAIIEFKDGRYGAVEIKLNSTQAEAAAATLKRFEKKMLNIGATAPVCLLAVTSSGIAYTRDDGVIVAPITTLRP
jgi:predicted AAA+ superfamily ATPase